MMQLPRPAKPVSLFLGVLTACAVGGILLSAGVIIGLAVTDPSLRPIGWTMVVVALALAVIGGLTVRWASRLEDETRS